MKTAYKRVSDLLDRWQASLDLHARYLALDDEAYAKVQAWPKHERPTKWVLDVARSRLEAVRRELALREEAGDPTYAESLELMGLLTNLLGSEHVERFVPLATGKSNTGTSGTARRPRIKPPESRPAPPRAGPAPAARPAPKPAGPRTQAPPPPAADKVVATVVADAVRFLKWGREWPALAPSIARLASRPSEAEIVRILRANRALIEQRARHTAT